MKFQTVLNALSICALIFISGCGSDEAEVNKWLGKQAIKVNERGKDGETLMHIAAADGRADVMKWLKTKGEIVSPRDQNDSTPMFYAAKAGHIEVIKWLKKQGADVNAKNNRGDTALNLATINNHDQLRKWLLSNGADIVGSLMKFGGDYWRVLAVEKGKVLLLSGKILEERAYGGSTWESSDIRKYLNGEFLNSFTQADRNRIADTKVVTNNNPWYGTTGGNATNDKVFLLSLEELVQYFGDSGKLKNRPGQDDYYFSDQYSQSRIAYDKNGTASWWWLRSPGFSTITAAIVDGDGDVNVNGLYVYILYGGVRPALWLNL